MAHQIDNSKGFNAFVSLAAPAWHGLGTVLTDAISVEQALQLAGLDFMVLKLPNVHILPDESEIISEDSFFTLRTDTNRVLGSRLGRDYQVLQNMEALNVVNDILDSGTAVIETAGVLNEGRTVFVCLKVTTPIVIGSGDTIDQYVLITNTHDGTRAITAMPTNVRVVCANTLAAALRGAQSRISIRHTLNAANRLSEAARVLKLIHDNEQANADSYAQMLDTVISKEQMFNYFGNVYLKADEIEALQDGKKAQEVLSRQKQTLLADTLDFAQRGAGQSITMKGSDFTMWSAYNAVTGVLTRKRFASVNDRANSLLFGGVADTLTAAGVLALQPAAVKPLHRKNFDNLNLN